MAGILKLSDKAFIVGGQALNLWAERYSHVEELAAYGPYTSKDIDYFGQRAAAQKLANAFKGELLIPDADDHTPQTAVVRAVIEGQKVEIDFLWHVKGVDDDSLKSQAIDLKMTVKLREGIGELHVPIMHPFHCMQSRLANVVGLGRRTELALRQLEASPIVLREYLREVLANGGHKHVTGVLQALYKYLITGTGRRAHNEMKNDPATILAAFQDDERLDAKWRELSLASMLRTIDERRTAWGGLQGSDR